MPIQAERFGSRPRIGHRMAIVLVRSVLVSANMHHESKASGPDLESGRQASSEALQWRVSTRQRGSRLTRALPQREVHVEQVSFEA